MDNHRFQRIIDNGDIVLVDFYTEWCAPCQVIKPILKELKKEFSDTVRIVLVDVGKNPFIAAKYDIATVPTLILFKGGEPVWIIRGVTTFLRLKEVLLDYI